jgi:hypothetical protein
MSIYRAIKALIPGIQDHQFTLQDDSDGRGPYIAEWLWPEPQPSAQLIAATIENLPPEWADQLKDEFRDERELLLNRMMSIAGRKVRAGDTEFALALDWLAEAIIPLDADPQVVQATTEGYEQGRAAYKMAYRSLAAAALQRAPDLETAMRWKSELDRVFK